MDADSQDSPSKGALGKSLRAVAQLSLVFVLIVAAVYVRIVLRMSGYKADAAHVTKGAGAEEIFRTLSHADGVRVSWRPEATDAVAPPRTYAFRGGTLSRPMRTDGAPATPERCRIEYRIFMFRREFIEVDFDESGFAKAVKASSLD